MNDDNRCPKCGCAPLADGTPSHTLACPYSQAAQEHWERVREQYYKAGA